MDVLPVVCEWDGLGVGPEALETVVIPVLFLEHVNHQIHVIQEDPVALPFAFPSVWLYPECLRKVPLDLFGDRSNLTVGVAAADQEVVGDDELRRNVEDDDALALLRRSGLSCLENYVPGLLVLRSYRVRRKSFPTTIVRSTIPWSWVDT